jgi:hypothetical protein
MPAISIGMKDWGSLRRHILEETNILKANQFTQDVNSSGLLWLIVGHVSLLNLDNSESENESIHEIDILAPSNFREFLPRSNSCQVSDFAKSPL